MKKVLIFAIAILPVAGKNAPVSKHAPLKEADLPPLVLMGTGRLDCTISNKENGRQKLSLTSGSGVAFDVTVTPILDGVVEIKNGRLKSEAKGVNYRFTSHLAEANNFRVSGMNKVELMHLETKVSVNARKFRQDKGPGTAIEFASEDMDRQGVYIEFRGLFREIESKRRFSFRTVMGPPTHGSGVVTPTDSNNMSRIEMKTVVSEIKPTPGEPFTQITTTIRELD